MNGLFLVLVALPAALFSFVLEAKRKNTAPATQLPFTWGYFVRVRSFLLGFYLLLAAIYLALTAEQSNAPGTSLLLFLAGVWGIPGFYAIKRKRWAWVVTTIVSLNPVWWIANTVYGKNRWDEFDTDDVKRPVSAPASI